MKNNQPVPPEQIEEINFINKQILENSKIEEFASVIKMQDRLGQISYLDFTENPNKIPRELTFEKKKKKLVAKPLYDMINSGEALPELTLKVFTKNIQTNIQQVSTSMRQEEITSLKERFDIDVVSMLRNVMINESAQALTKEFRKKLNELATISYENSFTKKDNFYKWFFKIFRKTYVKKVKPKNVRQLISHILMQANLIAGNGLIGPGNFVICSCRTASMLADEGIYSFASINLPTSNGNIYASGKIANLTIYVDPYMLWSDNTIYIGRKTKDVDPGIKLFFNEKGTSLIVTASGVEAPKLIIRTESKIDEVGFYPHNQYRKIIYDDKHIKE